MVERLDEAADLFGSVDPEMRLELLLDYANKLPPLPEEHHAARDAGLNKVPECVTPVYMFAAMEQGPDGTPRLRLHVDVAEEAPTVRGLMSIIVSLCDEASPADVAELPRDLLVRLGLHTAIGPQRQMGLSGIINRVRKLGAEAA
jgi:cysteine desulfuration protein SufE